MTDIAPTAYQDVEAERVVRTVSDFVNGYGHSSTAFVNYMAREHRTLQQGFTRICLAWLKHLAALPDHAYDLRNEHSVKVARIVARELEAAHGSRWDQTPLI